MLPIRGNSVTDGREASGRRFAEQIQGERILEKALPSEKRSHEGKLDDLSEVLLFEASPTKMLELTLPDTGPRGEFNCPFKLPYGDSAQRA